MPVTYAPEASSIERRAALDKLLTEIVAADGLYLRRKIQEQFLWGKFPGLQDLPLEILLLIADCFGLEDYIHCCDVSCTWRETWTQLAISTKICQRHFPGLYESDTTNPWNPEPFLRASRARLARCCSSLTCREFKRRDKPLEQLTDTDDDKFPFYAEPVLLHHDRYIAWQLDGTDRTAYVGNMDCTTEGSPRQYFAEATVELPGDIRQGLSHTIRAMSQNILVTIEDSSLRRPIGQMMHVYHLQKKTWEHVLLPITLSNVVADGERAVIFGNRCQYVYQWKGQLLDMSMENWAEAKGRENVVLPNGSRRSCPAIKDRKLHIAMFHPIKTDQIYLAGATDIEWDHVQSYRVLHVVKFIGQHPCEYWQTKPLVITLRPEEINYAYTSEYWDSHKMSNYGSYLLSIRGLGLVKRKDVVEEPESDDASSHDSQCELCAPGRRCTCLRKCERLGSTCFNVCSETFSHLVFRPPEGFHLVVEGWPDEAIFRAWDNELWVLGYGADLRRLVVALYRLFAEEMPMGTPEVLAAGTQKHFIDLNTRDGTIGCINLGVASIELESMRFWVDQGRVFVWPFSIMLVCGLTGPSTKSSELNTSERGIKCLNEDVEES